MSRTMLFLALNTVDFELADIARVPDHTLYFR